ncbi:MAG: rod shape-determining protein MreC [Nocardioidaceae bacterium]
MVPSSPDPDEHTDGRTGERTGERTGAGRRTHRLFLVLLLASATLVTLDVSGGPGVGTARDMLGNVVGPVEEAVAEATAPITSLPQTLQTNRTLRNDVARLQADNGNLKSELADRDLAAAKERQLRGLVRTSADTGYALLPAKVVAMGPAQSFSRTVTIDRGRRNGVYPDMTVLNHDGLVGRVIRSDDTTATVLLIVDDDSVVGGRLGHDLEVGFVRGDGNLTGKGRLHLELVDSTATPDVGDVVTTWGSRGGAPYVAGIRIGTVESVSASPRELSQTATIKPAVDFSSLDVVAIVVDDDAPGALIKASQGGTRGGGR